MDTQVSPANALRTRNTYKSYLSGVGYAATRLHSGQDLPCPLEYASMEKVATRLRSCEEHPSPSKYVGKERSGYAAMWLHGYAATWLCSDCVAA